VTGGSLAARGRGESASHTTSIVTWSFMLYVSNTSAARGRGGCILRSGRSLTARNGDVAARGRGDIAGTHDDVLVAAYCY